MSRPPRELYVEQRSFEQYDAIDFFDFCRFSSDEMAEAVFQWKSLILPLVFQDDPAQHKRLVVSWDESKRTRQKYWDSKRLEEKLTEQLDDHIDHIRKDTIKQTHYVSSSLTRDVAGRLQGLSAATSASSRSPSTIQNKNTFLDPFAPSSSPFTWTTPSRLKGKRTAAGAKDLDNAETSDENVQSPEPFVDGEDAEVDEMARFGSNTSDDTDSEGHAVHDVSVDDQEELQEIEEAIACAQSPFLPLLEYLYKKVKGQDAELPPVPPTFICQEHKELYQYAYDKFLVQDQEDKAKAKKSKSRLYHVDKDVLVALSGIVNTISPSTRSFISTSAIKVDSLVMSLDEKDDDLAGLMDELVEAYSPGHKEDPLALLDMESLRMKIWSLLLEYGAISPKTKIVRRKMQVLQVVDHICTLISTNQLTPPTTEHVVVSVWSFILAVLLGGQVVRGIPGELASQAAKDVRLHVEAKYGVTTKNVRGRKVDISVRVFANGTWDNEICIFEFKTGAASDLICARQQLKSVRINTAVLHDLEFKGVDTRKHFPIIAEGRGFCLSFYTLKRIGDVMTAGKSTRGMVWIPSDMVQLKQFLKSDSIQILLKFADHLSRYAVHVQETLSSICRPPLPSTPPPRYKEPFAAFTPHKHNKRKYTGETDEDQDVVEEDDME